MSAELAAIQHQVTVIFYIVIGAGVVTALSFLKDLLFTSRRRRYDPFNDPTDLDHQKVYLLAPTPNQRWTSQYQHPASELSPTGFVLTRSEADEIKLQELLTPSKDWWSGHKSTPSSKLRSVAAAALAPLSKLDFGGAGGAADGEFEQTITTTTTTKKIIRTSSGKKAKKELTNGTTPNGSSRTSRRKVIEPEPEPEPQPEPEEEEEIEKQLETKPEPSPEPASPEPMASNGRDSFSPGGGDYDFVAGGDNNDDDEPSASPDSSDETDTYANPSLDAPSRTSSGGRRSSGTPSKHRRQWTHTVVPGVEEARIHRKGGFARK